MGREKQISGIVIRNGQIARSTPGGSGEVLTVEETLNEGLSLFHDG